MFRSLTNPLEQIQRIQHRILLETRKCCGCVWVRSWYRVHSGYKFIQLCVQGLKTHMSSTSNGSQSPYNKPRHTGCVTPHLKCQPIQKLVCVTLDLSWFQFQNRPASLLFLVGVLLRWSTAASSDSQNRPQPQRPILALQALYL